jgi:Iron-containing redox enzyme
VDRSARALLRADSAAPSDQATLFARLDDMLAPPDPESPAERYVADECTSAGLRVLVAEFAVDALTEAQSFLPIVQRLPIEARMPVLRVLVDEFGSGNLRRAHSRLYMDLLEELGLSTELEDHAPTTAAEPLAFVNLFYWLAARADTSAWFLGALAHLEASIVDGFACYVAGCERLGVVHDDYYREHVHIDGFHRREMRTAIKVLEQRCGFDHAAAWAGARLAATTFDAAFETAVARARAAE